MPWNQNKRLKITLLKGTPRKQDISIEFEVADEKREDFHRTLQYVLASCQTAGATFEFDETVDLESHEVIGLEVKLLGDQRKLQEIINQQVRGLQSNAVWAK